MSTCFHCGAPKSPESDHCLICGTPFSDWPLLAERKHRPVIALGRQLPDGTIEVTDVLCMHFPDMTDEEMAALSWKLCQFSSKAHGVSFGDCL